MDDPMHKHFSFWYKTFSCVVPLMISIIEIFGSQVKMWAWNQHMEIYMWNRVKIRQHVGVEFCVLICFHFRLGPKNNKKVIQSNLLLLVRLSKNISAAWLSKWALTRDHSYFWMSDSNSTLVHPIPSDPNRDYHPQSVLLLEGTCQ